MVERDKSEHELPFTHPDVQLLLRDNTELVSSTHLRLGMLGKLCQSISGLIQGEITGVPHEVENVQRAEQIWAALHIEAPIAVRKLLCEYESIEESLYLVKVDASGHEIPGSAAEVAILDHKTQAVLILNPTFTREDIQQVIGMVERQETLPWSPGRPLVDSISN